MPATTRAKAVEGNKADSQTAKISAPALKVASVPGRAKRKIRPEEENDLSEPGNPAKARQEDNARNKRGAVASGPPPPKAEEKPPPLAPKAPRGRPRKNPVSADPPAAVVPSAKTSASSTKTTTRTRTGSTAETATGPKSQALKKRVTFKEEDEENKENVMVMTNAAKRPKSGDGKTRPAEKLPGLKAKPVRKAVGKGAATKGAKKAQGNDEGAVAEKPRPEPLSPKKDTQVAKGDSGKGQDGDELSNPNTPPKKVGQSPVKLSPTAVQDGPPTSVVLSSSRMDHAANELAHPSACFVSPMVNQKISIERSPPRRPPPSPFKNSMKESPKKLGDIRPQSSSDNETATLKESVIMKSPKKFNTGNSQAMPALKPAFNASLAASLFGSPARRPTSPFKGFTSGTRTTVPGASLVTSTTTASGLAKSPRKPIISAVKSVTSSFKAVRSPEAAAKVHKMTLEEQATMLQDDAGGRLLSFQLKQALPYIAMSTPWQPGLPVKDMKSISGSPSSIPIRSPPRLPLSTSETPILSKLSDANITLATTLDVSGTAKARSTTPPGRPTELAKQSFSFRSPATQQRADDESEDELQSTDPRYQATPRAKFNQVAEMPYTPTPMCVSKTPKTNIHSMTALAKRFGAWTGASPDKKVIEQREAERSVFSLIKMSAVELEVPEYEPEIMPSPQHPCYFEEAMAIREDEDDVILDLPATCSEDELFRQSQMSSASQEYGDENAIPIDPALLALGDFQATTCTPARVFNQHPHVIHTVSKVPLKPAAGYDDSPVAGPVRRCHSMSGVLSPRADLELQALRQIHPLSHAYSMEPTSASLVISESSEKRADEHVTPRKSEEITNAELARAMTDLEHTPRSDLQSRLLSGAVVYVDVHTTEGADASGIFMELLAQMGAKCVKQWNWNSRASLGCDTADGESRVGITHVVFKDGGKRTMEKVREAVGLVLCVGVGWVLDCEREQKWLDEANYAIDTHTIPRGGHRRRKSMEPLTLSRMTSPARLSTWETTSPTKEFLNLSSPLSRQETIVLPPIDRCDSSKPCSEPGTRGAEASNTPTRNGIGLGGVVDTPGGSSTYGSPATPYFLYPERLVQQTCPPKQMQQLLFPLSGRIEDQPDERLKQRLWLARRKSLQFAPKVGSPLAPTALLSCGGSLVGVWSSRAW